MRSGTAVIPWLLFTSDLVDSFNLGFGPPMAVGTLSDRKNFILHHKMIKSFKKTKRTKMEKARAQKKHQRYLAMTIKRRRKKFANDLLMQRVRML